MSSTKKELVAAVPPSLPPTPQPAIGVVSPIMAHKKIPNGQLYRLLSVFGLWIPSFARVAIFGLQEKKFFVFPNNPTLFSIFCVLVFSVQLMILPIILFPEPIVSERIDAPEKLPPMTVDTEIPELPSMKSFEKVPPKMAPIRQPPTYDQLLKQGKITSPVGSFGQSFSPPPIILPFFLTNDLFCWFQDMTKWSRRRLRTPSVLCQPPRQLHLWSRSRSLQLDINRWNSVCRRLRLQVKVWKDHVGNWQ